MYVQLWCLLLSGLHRKHAIVVCTVYISLLDDIEDPHVKIPECREPPSKDYQDNILDSELLASLIEYLENAMGEGKFRALKGRFVLKLGKEYTYSGDSSQPSSTDIPPIISRVVDRVMEKFNLTHRPNSILINFYPSTESSFCPYHSDDEASILADSEIACLSIGDVRTLKFKGIHHKAESTITPASNSVYT